LKPIGNRAGNNGFANARVGAGNEKAGNGTKRNMMEHFFARFIKILLYSHRALLYYVNDSARVTGLPLQMVKYRRRFGVR
jgi:hypothetical protein